MKILYGVVGEGMGHAMRSRVILEHLFAREHEVTVMASGRAAEFLGKRFAHVNRIAGLHIVYDENTVAKTKTLWSNVLQQTTGVPQNIAAYFELIRAFSPDLVISDFESWAHLFAKTHGLPIFSIDNMQIINRCKHPDDVIGPDRTTFQLTKAFIKGKLPFCDHYFITTFFYPDVRKKRTTLHPPILRPEILAANRRPGEHLLVYQTGEGNEGLADTLQRTGLECRVYGMRRSITEEQVEGNLRYRPFSESGFIDDLASARAVIAGGGFTTMGEAVYLRKPMLAVPLEGQFEQVMNARYLQREGYGRYAPTLADPAHVRSFVEELPRFEANLAGYSQDGNTHIQNALDAEIDKVAAGLL